MIDLGALYYCAGPQRVPTGHMPNPIGALMATRPSIGTLYDKVRPSLVPINLLSQ